MQRSVGALCGLCLIPRASSRLAGVEPSRRRSERSKAAMSAFLETSDYNYLEHGTKRNTVRIFIVSDSIFKWHYIVTNPED